jgi:hypothetical protein
MRQRNSRAFAVSVVRHGGGRGTATVYLQIPCTFKTSK